MYKQIMQLVGMSLLAGLVALPSAASADPPPWAPAHGYRAKQHRYIYYPRYDVYYAPETRLWFWLDGEHWRVSAGLPGDIVVSGPGVAVVLSTERPYEENTYIVEHYGGSHHEHYRDRDEGDDDDD